MAWVARQPVKLGGMGLRCWRILKAEAESAAEWIGGDVEGPLVADVEKAALQAALGPPKWSTESAQWAELCDIL